MSRQNVGGPQLPSSSGLFLQKDFGAVGDDSTDDTAAVNAWLGAATSNRGPTLYVEPGIYKLTDAITNLKTGLIIQGLGYITTGPGAAYDGMGSVFSQHTTGKWCWIQGPASSASNVYQGCAFRDIGFRDSTATFGSGTASGGMLLYSGDNELRNCVASLFSSGPGFQISIPTGGADASSLNHFLNSTANDCLTGAYDTAGYTTFLNFLGQKFTAGGILHAGYGIRLGPAGNTSTVIGGHMESNNTGLLVECLGKATCIGTTFEDNSAWDINLNRASGTSGTRSLIVATTSLINIGSFNVGDVIVGGNSATIVDAGDTTQMYGAHEVTKISRSASGSAPTGGYSGQITVQNGRLYYNDGGTWKGLLGV